MCPWFCSRGRIEGVEKMGKNGEKQFRVNVAALRLGYSESYTRRLIREGKLPARRESPRKTWVSESALETFQSGAGES